MKIHATTPRRLLAMIMALCMIMSIIPSSVLSEEAPILPDDNSLVVQEETQEEESPSPALDNDAQIEPGLSADTGSQVYMTAGKSACYPVYADEELTSVHCKLTSEEYPIVFYATSRTESSIHVWFISSSGDTENGYVPAAAVEPVDPERITPDDMPSEFRTIGDELVLLFVYGEYQEIIYDNSIDIVPVLQEDVDAPSPENPQDILPQADDTDEPAEQEAPTEPDSAESVPEIPEAPEAPAADDPENSNTIDLTPAQQDNDSDNKDIQLPVEEPAPSEPVIDQPEESAVILMPAMDNVSQYTDFITGKNAQVYSEAGSLPDTVSVSMCQYSASDTQALVDRWVTGKSKLRMAKSRSIEPVLIEPDTDAFAPAYPDGITVSEIPGEEKTSSHTAYAGFEVSLINQDGSAYEDKGSYEVTVIPEEGIDLYAGLPKGAKISNVSFSVYHIHDGVEQIPVSEKDVIINEYGQIQQFTFPTGSFSDFIFSYTVDFTYTDPITLLTCPMVSIAGESSVMLGELMARLNLSSMSLIGSSATFTNPAYLRLTAATDEFGEVYDWEITSLAPFTSAETLTVTLNDGTIVKIDVTDASFNEDSLKDVPKNYGYYDTISTGSKYTETTITTSTKIFGGIFAYHTLKDLPVYCIERDIEAKDGKDTYTAKKWSSLGSDDMGVRFILRNAYPYRYPDGMSTIKAIACAQIALWNYLKVTSYGGHNTMSDVSLWILGSSNMNSYANTEEYLYVKWLVDGAKAASSAKTPSITLKQTQAPVLSSKKHVGKIKVTVKNADVYRVKESSIPDGVTVKGNSGGSHDGYLFGKSGDELTITFTKPTAKITVEAYWEDEEISMRWGDAGSSAQQMGWGDVVVPKAKASENITLEAKGDLTITKKDNRGTKMSGVSFKITGPDDYSVTKKTNDDSIISLTGLTIGTYKIVETVPTGYRTETTSHSVTVESAKESKITIENIRQAKIKVIKVDSKDASIKLKSAVFEVYNSDGDKVATLTTGSDGTATTGFLDWGKYTLKEVTVPTGYKLISLETSANLQVSADDAGKTVEVTVKNEPQAKVKVKKVDAADSTVVLPGAVFEVKDLSGATVATLTTGEDGTATSGWLDYGQYTMTEKTAPANYEKLANPVIVDLRVKGGQTITYTVKNTGLAKIRVTKVSSKDNTEVIPGVVFDVLTATGSVADTITTGEDGTVTTKDLPLGTYSLVEKSTIEGYKLDTTPITVVLDVKPGETKDITVKNAPEDQEQGKIRVLKVDADDADTKLSGAVFEVYDSSNTLVDTLVTGEDGTAESRLLALGTYRLVEKTAPQGYIAVSSEIEAILDSVNGKDITVTNKLNPMGKIRVKKVDTSNESTVLSGAVFEVYDADGTLVDTITTGNDGLAETKLLPLGEYSLVETDAPQDYVLNSTPIPVNLDVENGQTKEIVARNTKPDEPVGRIRITKTDSSDADKLLKGAVFEVYDSSDNKVDTLTTGENGIAESRDLPLGNYVVREVTAPDNYSIISGDIPVELTESVLLKELIVENCPQAYLRVLKVDKDNTDTVLPGVEFDILNDEGDIIDHITTGNDGYAVSKLLDIGTYRLRETKGFDGYTLPEEPIPVELQAEAGETVNFTVENARNTFSIRIKKVDSETGNVIPLADTQFQIRDLSGNVVGHESYTTDKTGTVLLQDKFPAGSYDIVELEAPNGYLLGESKRIEITNTGTEEEIVFTYEDSPVKGRIAINKKGLQLVRFEDKTLNGIAYKFPVYEERFLAGAVFEIRAAEDITGVDGTEWYSEGDLADTITTTAAGNDRSKLLPLGTYTITEITAPDGYANSSKPETVTLACQDDKTPVIEKTFDMTNDLATVSISLSKEKADIQPKALDDGMLTQEIIRKPGEGFTFALSSTEEITALEGSVPAGTILAVGVTDADGKLTISGHLPFGIYTVKECIAPEGWIMDAQEYTVELPVNAINKENNNINVNIPSVIFNDREYRLFTALKVDTITGLPVEGALLELSDSNGIVVARGYTDAESKLSGIPLVPGTYTLREAKAPEGYVLNDKPVTVVVQADGKVHAPIEITMENTPVQGTIWIDKTGEQLIEFLEMQQNGFTVNVPVYDTRYLSGAIFEVYARETITDISGKVLHEKDELVDTITTTANGHDESSLLPLGKYYVREVSAPVGFDFDTTVEYDVELKYKDQETEIVHDGFAAENHYIPMRLAMYKSMEILNTSETESGMVHAEITEEAGSGFVFGLYNKSPLSSMEGTLPADSLVATSVTGEDGYLRLNGLLPHGEYYLKELTKDNRWLPNDGIIDIHLTTEYLDDEEGVIIGDPEVSFINELNYTRIRITKSNLTNTATVPGAVIEIYDSEGRVVYREITGEDGSIPDIPVVPGKYTFKETIAPEGYALNTAIMEFEIGQDGQVIGYVPDLCDDYTRIKLLKTDKTDGSPVPGAEFTLFDQEHNAVMTAVSDDDGLVVFEKIPYGTFTIEETKAPDGYLPVDGPVTNAIVVDGKFVNDPEPIAEVPNYPNGLRGLKTDRDGNPLEGAAFGLYDENGREIQSATTNDEGIFIFRNVKRGTYTVRETKAPDGYLLNMQAQSITVDDNTQTSGEILLRFVNQRKQIKYIKVDTSGKFLEGVEFALINASTGETVETVTSNDKGEFILTQFDYGDWIIRETKAPEGYSRMEDIRLHVDENWTEPEPFTCVNIPNHYEFIKVDNNGNPLAGVKFTLEDSTGSVVKNLTSGEDGIVHVTGLNPGKYVIREREALDGFVKSDEAILLEIDEKYVVPQEMYRFVNYPVIQTGVTLENPWMVVGGIVLGLALIALGIAIHKRKKYCRK